MLNNTLQGFRLSPQQRHLWSLQQDSLAYQSQCTILLEGKLNPEVFKSALQTVVNRYEIFRTTFHRLPGMKVPIQVVGDSSIPSWSNINLSDWDCQEQIAKIEEILQEERGFRFKFEQGSLLRSSLITLSNYKHILLVTLPSLCADAWTLKNLVQEISQAYAACLQGEEVSSEVVQYIQFSEWQNELLEEEDAQTGKEYWRNQNVSKLAKLKLPFEGKFLGKQEFEPSFLPVKLDPSFTTRIAAVMQQYNASASVFLLTCWQVLLRRLIGKSDIVIGNVCDGRKYEELHGAMGLFAKSLPVYCHLAGNLPFSEVLRQVHQATQTGYDWQEYFVWEQSLSQENKEGFPISFEFEELSGKYVAADVVFSIYKRYVCIDRFKVKLSCINQDDSLVAEFHYDANLFLAEDIERLAGQFQTLLASAIAHPETAISQLEILNPRERQLLLVGFNNTKTDYPKDQCIHQLFEEQAEQTPNNIAVVFEDQQLTYAELNTRANKVAYYLQRLGVGPEVLVGLYVERSLELVIGLLGILKAGGAYVPLDPALPTQGLAVRLQDAQPPVLLTQQQLVTTLPEHTAQVVCLDTDWEMIAQENGQNPQSGATTENLIYVMFTSGSTGRPKGVAVEHQQLLNYLYGIWEKLHLPVGGSYAIASTFAADLGNTAIFPCLCIGGCLHVLSQECASDPEILADYCRRHPIDCLKIVPSHLGALLASSHPQAIAPRQQLILGGEAASWNLIEQIQRYAPACQIFNHYGPTESTVGVLTYKVESKPADGHSAIIPLGRPLPNTQIYLLDQHLQPVPIGVTGELYIGGAGLARGYLNQPELTAERFINNPFSSAPESRLYKTGDLARYQPDGTIEFLGRIDDQVKIRGYRIELGEIEAVLTEHPGVRATVVLAREDEPGNKRLVAYVIPDQEPAPNTTELRRFLQEQLPEYMVPSAFVLLKALPLTPNGKVDRQALPAPDHARPELEKTFVAPRTPTEEVLAGIWAEVLGLERIGIHDNFFELGGHSLLATQVTSRLRTAFQVEIPLRQLFESPTVADLSAIIAQKLVEQADSEMLAQMLTELEELSEDEVQAVFTAEQHSMGKKDE